MHEMEVVEGFRQVGAPLNDSSADVSDLEATQTAAAPFYLIKPLESGEGLLSGARGHFEREPISYFVPFFKKK